MKSSCNTLHYTSSSQNPMWLDPEWIDKEVMRFTVFFFKYGMPILNITPA